MLEIILAVLCLVVWLANRELERELEPEYKMVRHEPSAPVDFTYWQEERYAWVGKVS